MNPLERRIKARLAAMDLTLQDLARLGGCTVQSIRNWLNGGLTTSGRACLRNGLGVSD